MSAKSHTELKNNYSRFHRFTTEKLFCHYLTPPEMAEKTIKMIRDQGFILSQPTKDRLQKLFVNILANKECRKITEPMIRSQVIDAVLKRQEKRLFAIQGDIHSRRKIKSITVNDIPQNAVIAGQNILFY
jgi:hypothetical protein